ncbi:hypothetical protein V8E51_009277 [Hyaloscypha variabilis]
MSLESYIPMKPLPTTPGPPPAYDATAGPPRYSRHAQSPIHHPQIVRISSGRTWMDLESREERRLKNRTTPRTRKACIWLGVCTLLMCLAIFLGLYVCSKRNPKST